MPHRFPIYSCDADVQCWKCGNTLDGHDVVQSAIGQGLWEQQCPVCKVWTRYDVRCDSAGTEGTLCPALATTRRDDLPLCGDCATAMDERGQEQRWGA